MEPKFVNRIIQTEKNLREMQFASLGKLRIVIYAVVSLFVILTAILLFTNGSTDSAIMMSAMGLILILVGFIRPILAARKQYKRNTVIANSQVLSPTELRFYEDHFVTYNKIVEKELSFTYDRFLSFKKTKHLFLLKLPEQLYLLIDRTGFTVGTAEEFEAFIKEKIKK